MNTAKRRMKRIFGLVSFFESWREGFKIQTFGNLKVSPPIHPWIHIAVAKFSPKTKTRASPVGGGKTNFRKKQQRVCRCSADALTTFFGFWWKRAPSPKRRIPHWSIRPLPVLSITYFWWTRVSAILALALIHRRRTIHFILVAVGVSSTSQRLLFFYLETQSIHTSQNVYHDDLT